MSRYSYDNTDPDDEDIEGAVFFSAAVGAIRFLTRALRANNHARGWDDDEDDD